MSWYDKDIKKVERSPITDPAQLYISTEDGCTDFILSKDDIVEMAKMLDLVVFDKTSML